MADNFEFTPGSGGIGAADDIGGVLHPRVKVVWGPDGTANDTDVASGKALPVQLRDASGNAVAPLTESDFDTKIGSLTETAPTTDTSSSGLNGRLQRIAQRITSLIALIPSALTGSGNFKVSLQESNASQASTVVDGGNVTLGAKADAKSTATDTTAISVMSVLKQISASVQAAASSLAGTITVAAHAVTQSGTWTVQPGNTANTTPWKVDGSAVTQPVSIATNTPVGNVAHDGADSGAPIKVGGRARSSEVSAVSSDDRSDLITDLVGKLIVLPYANPENFLNGTTSAITDTTSTTAIGAQGAGIRIYVTSVIVTNSHATVGTFVKILDDTTIIWEGYAASLGGGFTQSFPVPLRGTANKDIKIQCVTTGANVIASVAGYKGV
ncbi:hypothetical protein [Bradyrhizobium sp. UNPF46]|uniref:hypothetical protein n=1 Tax=Bradyrhizobium sp. UNPF46 TaxID=1141168 RepID=UPI0011509062|nr:hypothetical protein [Bradyrhizobium sp. UNPF46]